MNALADKAGAVLARVPAAWRPLVVLGALLGAGAGLFWAAGRFGWVELSPEQPDNGGDEMPADGDGWQAKVEAGPHPVAHRERADGVDARLQAFLDAWEQEGPFRICVCPDGGVRTDDAKQAALYADGKSNAPTLASTPHGHGGALDVAPYYRNAAGLYAPHWEDRGPFEAIGNFARGRGLVWGGSWTGKMAGDLDHVEVPDWRSLPVGGAPNVA